MTLLYYRDKLSYLFSRMSSRKNIYGFVYMKQQTKALLDSWGYQKGTYVKDTRAWMEARPIEGTDLYACFKRADHTHKEWSITPWRQRSCEQVSSNVKSAFTRDEAQALICEYEQLLAKNGYAITTKQAFTGLLREEPKLLTHQPKRLA